jgi:NAD(P)-dependent dehydrogenase (short-subunit alcohol dehydrogenase family)
MACAVLAVFAKLISPAIPVRRRGAYNRRMNNAAQKIAIVTGASSGIGKATAVALFADGWHVVFAGRRLDRLEQAVEEANQEYRRQARDAKPVPRALAVQTDVTSEESVRNLFARTRETFGRLDLLFNNAGISGQELPVEDLSIEIWRSVIDTNLTGMFLCIQEAVRIMKNQTPRGGRIINNGSISAQVPRRNSIAYTATKHAVTGLTKSIALDARDFDIACGQIDVGRIESEIGGSASGATANPSAIPKLDTRLAAQAVLQMANLPIEANMLFTTLLPTKMPFVGRG